MGKRVRRGDSRNLQASLSSLGHRPRIFLLIALLLILLLLLFISPSHRGSGALVYRDAGYGYGGGTGIFWGFSFVDMYYRFGYLIDAALFLLIFMGIGKIVFTQHFGPHAKPVYTGIGLFLAFALLMWEETTGVYLLEYAGPAVVVLLLLILMLFLIRVLMALRFHWLAATLVVWIFFYFGVVRRIPFLSDAYHEFLQYFGLGRYGQPEAEFMLFMALFVMLGALAFAVSRTMAKLNPPHSHHH